MSKFIAYLFSLLLLTLVTSVNAVVVKDLYSANIPVQDQSSQNRTSALKQALQQVLVKVSGDTATLDNDQIKAALKNVNNYLQQYSYEKNPNQQLDGMPFVAQATFVSKAINSLLLSANLPVWGRDRPLTLFWIAQSINNKAALVAASSNNPILAMIEQSAQQRGLPVIFPVLDQTDRHQLSVNDVMAPFVGVIAQASTRYGSNAIVIVQLTQVGSGWNSSWTLVANNQLQVFQVKNNDQEQLVQQGMDKVVDALASQFALKNNASQSAIKIKISGIESFSMFSRARRYLNRLAQVKQVSVIAVGQDQATFMLSLAGSMQELKQAIKLDHTLTLITDENGNAAAATLPTEDDNSQVITLNYQWTP